MSFAGNHHLYTKKGYRKLCDLADSVVEVWSPLANKFILATISEVKLDRAIRISAKSSIKSDTISWEYNLTPDHSVCVRHSDTFELIPVTQALGSTLLFGATFGPFYEHKLPANISLDDVHDPEELMDILLPDSQASINIQQARTIVLYQYLVAGELVPHLKLTFDKEHHKHVIYLIEHLLDMLSLGKREKREEDSLVHFVYPMYGSNIRFAEEIGVPAKVSRMKNKQFYHFLNSIQPRVYGLDEISFEKPATYYQVKTDGQTYVIDHCIFT